MNELNKSKTKQSATIVILLVVTVVAGLALAAILTQSQNKLENTLESPEPTAAR